MKLIVGLGNPGKKYEHTRHNVGFLALTDLARQWDVEFETKKKLFTEIGKHSEIILAKPQTFMNDSGRAVQKILTTYKLQLADLLVLHDDVDLPFGTIKLASPGTGSAGHRGVESIIQSLGGKNFARIRIGINRRADRHKPSTDQYVLENFTPAEQTELKTVILPKIAAGLQALLKQTGI